ncbi:MAG: glycogen synthase GlgA [Clostridiales bacterium]|nr:glycogen synthase GlgA [Clostridiales bacterium]
MKILFTGSECVPFAKTGGLADVLGSLPAALVREGVDARVILPKYRIIDSYWVNRMHHECEFTVLMGSQQLWCGIDSVVDNGVTYYFVDNLAVFGGDKLYTGEEDDGFRFAFYCRAVLEALSRLAFFPDILHCNDWQAGLIPVLLHEQYCWDMKMRDIKSVFSIHNLRYQGLYTWHRIGSLLGLNSGYFTPDNLEFHGLLSFMKAGLVFATRICTVSPSYAEEIRSEYFGERLDGLLRHRQHVLSGILNGIDTAVYNPADDRFLSTHFTAENIMGKTLLKRRLQEELGLEPRDEPPLISMITRLTPQKGLDLVECVLHDLMRLDVQVAFLGNGDARYERFIRDAQAQYPGRVAARVELNEGLAHRIYAGSDMFLMPSQFEPCGLSQLISLRYGTIPIVRETGGLRDSIQPYNRFEDSGNGFSFRNYNAHEMLYALEEAVEYYHCDKEMWERLVQRAMACDFSWTTSAKAYLRLYQDILGIEPPPPPPKPKKSRKKPTTEIELTAVEIAPVGATHASPAEIESEPTPAKKPTASTAKKPMPEVPQS